MQFKYGINEKPGRLSEHAILSLQHVFAMFGSTILVPTLIGIDVGVALFCAGMGTLIYALCTKGKVPVFIGSSFAYIPILTATYASQGMAGVSFIVMSVGVVYMIISVFARFLGTKWIDYLLPSVVMGPLIIVIGLSLAPVAMSMAGITQSSFNFKHMIIAVFTLAVTLLALEKGNNFIKSIPVLMGIVSGYILSLILGVVDTSIFEGMQIISVPHFTFAFTQDGFGFKGNLLLATIPLIIVTISEHIGDHSVSSTICRKQFLKDPGLKATLLGDGLATFMAGLVGGPVNTTYAENTGVIILTKVASTKVIQLAAVFSMLIAFIEPVRLFIMSIPTPVMGGISITLFGLIAQNGIRILTESGVNFNYTRNMIIVALILVVGLGGGYIGFTVKSAEFAFTGMSLAAVFGIGAHLLLPDKKYSLNPQEHIVEENIKNELVEEAEEKLISETGL